MSNIGLNEPSTSRPDIVERLYKSKLKVVIQTVKQIFGKVEALIYMIEFANKGLPHAHFVLILNGHDK